jgi:membrane-associated protease RseP (regulator of RpoE activity)
MTNHKVINKMKINKPTLSGLILGLGILLLGSTFLSAEEEKGMDPQKIETIVAEAQRMAEDWASRIRGWSSEKDQSTTYMGIVIESVPDVLRDYIDLPKGVGLLLTKIAAEGPAAKAGLEDNDILVSFGGQLIINFSQLSTLIDLQGPGAEVPVKVLRKGEEMEFTVTLEERIRRGGRFIPPSAPDVPDVPEIPDADDLGMFMEQIEEWVPGSVSVFIDENEKVHVDLDDLKENLQDLRVKVERLKQGLGGPDGEIRREFGEFGARTSIVRVEDSNVNYTSNDGKLVLTSSEAGQQAMVWDADGTLIYQGALPEDFEGELPPKAVELIRAYNASREKLKLDTNGNSIDIQLNEDTIEPLTLLDR